MEQHQAKMVIEPAIGPDGKNILVFSYKKPLHLKNDKTIIGIIGASFWVDQEIVQNSILNNKQPEDVIHLTKRQTDCLYYLVKGMTIKKIAHTLKLSPKTIEHYIDAIKRKLNCSNRTQLIVKALQLSIIKYRLSK